MSRSLAIALAISLLAGPGIAGPERPSGIQETAEVILVEVPVRVTGRDGSPIRDLTAADFTLYDDGKKQEILGFDAIDLAERAQAPGQAINASGRRRFLFLFDLSLTRPRALLQARGAAKEFVLSGMGDSDLAAVATISIDTGVRLIANFSSDRVQLARAIDTLGLATSLAKGRDPLEFVYDLAAMQGTSVAGLGSPQVHKEKEDGSLGDSVETLRALNRATEDRYARGRLTQVIQSFEDLATVLDVFGGRKDIIYLSEGFESRLLVGTKDTEQEKGWIVSGELWKIDSDKRFGSSALQSQLEAMSGMLRRSDCVIHAVDINGIRTDADVSALEPMSDSALFEFAQGTGGEVFRNENDFRSGLAELLRRTSLVYVLAFRPNHMGGKGGYHELKVKVRTSGARVTARAGYYERRTFKVLSPLERGLLAADVIANEMPVSQIPARILASPVPGGQGPASVPVLLEVPGAELMLEQNGPQLPIEIYVYAYDAEGRLRDFFTQGLSIDLGINRERLETGGLRYYGQLTLLPGQYRVRALVRNSETGRMGFVAETIRVPDFSERVPYLAAPLFLGNSSEGIFVRGQLGAVGRALSTGLVAPPVGSQGLVPVALPEVRSGKPTQVSLVAYYFGPQQAQSLKIGAQILSEEGRPLNEGTIRFLSQSPAEADGKQTLMVSFTPETLSPGRYALRVFLQDSATGKAGYATAPFLIR